MICAQCGCEFGGRADARTCSTRCRVARHRAVVGFAPARMRGEARWVRQRAKRPLQVSGRPASSTDPRTWSPFAEAFASEVGDGLGFVLNGDGVVCVDLDGCVEDGRPSDWAAEVLALFPGAPVEWSLSGNGLHVWGTGPNVSTVTGFAGKRVEVYADKRYIAMTGRWMRPGDLADLSAGLAALV